MNASGHEATPRARRGTRAILRFWQAHRDLLDNTASLLGTTVVTSGLGVAFWAVAARLLSPESVGYGSATVSAMTLLGTVGMLGLGTLLMGELPRRTQGRPGLISAALLAAAAGSLLLALLFAVLASTLYDGFEWMTGSVELALLFCLGVSATAVTLVLDQATIGLLQGSLQFWRNVAFSVAKLAILLGAVFLVGEDRYGTVITASWLLGILASVVVVAWLIRRRGASVLHRPHLMGLKRLGRQTLAHTWLNLAFQVPRLLLPVLVAVSISASANSSFYIVWMLAGVLYMLPTQLSTVLFAVASAEPERLASQVRLTLKLSVALGLPAMLVLGGGASWVLSIFGPTYAESASVPLQLLVLGYLPLVPKVHYVAVCRATGRLLLAAAVMTAAAALEITATLVGGQLAGVTGVCAALLLSFVVEAIIMLPVVWRAAVPRVSAAQPSK